MPPRSYAAIALAGFLTVLGLRVGLSVGFDPFADFYFLTGIRTADYRSVDQLAERKVKRRMIEDATADDISLAIFGNSRTAGLDPALIDPKAVNLAFSGARTEEVELLLRRFKALHPRARILVALDFDQCFAAATANPLYLDPAADGEARRDAAIRLVAISALEDWVKAKAMDRTMPQMLSLRGNMVRAAIDPAQIEARRKIDVEVYRSFFGATHYRADCTATARAIRAQDPQVLFFVNPISADMAGALREAGSLEHLTEWRRDLAALGPVLDFSCSEAFRRGDFIDGHHYGPRIAGRMAADLTALMAGRRPGDGCLLTPERRP